MKDVEETGRSELSTELDPTNTSNTSLPCAPTMNLEFLITWTSIYILVGILVVFFNALVLLSFIKNKSLRTRTNYFIASLAFADFLVGALSVPGWLAVILSECRTNALLVQIWTSFDMLAGIGSIFHLMALSWDRLCAIVWPLKHRLYSRTKYIFILCLVWGFSTVVSGLSIIGNQGDTKAYNVSVIVLCFFMPLVVIILAQTTIFYRIHQGRYRGSGQRTIRHIKREIRAAKTISIMILLFVLGWLPFFTISLMNYITTVATSTHAIMAVKLLQYSNSFFNPILYAQKFPGFRRAYVAILCACSKEKKEVFKSYSSYPSCTYYKSGAYRTVTIRSSDTNRRYNSNIRNNNSRDHSLSSPVRDSFVAKSNCSCMSGDALEKVQLQPNENSSD